MGFGIAAAGLAVAGGLLGAKGAKDAAKAQKRAAEGQARLYREDARFARENAGILRSQADLKAKQLDRESRLRLGAIRAAGGASGRRAGDLSDIIMDVASQGELEKQLAWRAGALGARQEEYEAKRFDEMAQLSIETGEAAMSAGKIGAAASLLGGATKAFSFFA